ncbi:hypothetical protein [Candidatus Palauibacter sp.]|uniref:hypothetical protein n=1 Tax=Candidatus Palauibacter sp. TaxID=3101350 RepID=UPI003B5AA890
MREALRLGPADPRAHLELLLVLEARGDGHVGGCTRLKNGYLEAAGRFVHGSR